MPSVNQQVRLSPEIHPREENQGAGAVAAAFLVAQTVQPPDDAVQKVRLFIVGTTSFQCLGLEGAGSARRVRPFQQGLCGAGAEVKPPVCGFSRHPEL